MDGCRDNLLNVVTFKIFKTPRFVCTHVQYKNPKRILHADLFAWKFPEKLELIEVFLGKISYQRETFDTFHEPQESMHRRSEMLARFSQKR